MKILTLCVAIVLLASCESGPLIPSKQNYATLLSTKNMTLIQEIVLQNYVLDKQDQEAYPAIIPCLDNPGTFLLALPSQGSNTSNRTLDTYWYHHAALNLNQNYPLGSDIYRSAGSPIPYTYPGNLYNPSVRYALHYDTTTENTLAIALYGPSGLAYRFSSINNATGSITTANAYTLLSGATDYYVIGGQQYFAGYTTNTGGLELHALAGAFGPPLPTIVNGSQTITSPVFTLTWDDYLVPVIGSAFGNTGAIWRYVVSNTWQRFNFASNNSAIIPMGPGPQVLAAGLIFNNAEALLVRDGINYRLPMRNNLSIASLPNRENPGLVFLQTYIKGSLNQEIWFIFSQRIYNETSRTTTLRCWGYNYGTLPL